MTDHRESFWEIQLGILKALHTNDSSPQELFRGQVFEQVKGNSKEDFNGVQ